MHFKVLVPVKIPEREQNEALDAQITRDIAEMSDWLKDEETVLVGVNPI